ncbi:hypothetical protein [Aquibacillus rhizosphaerae]|uniref:Uncharacterized protein n=1 Tax=Aquibacillus rhizosphaerae TaxID=3051431 RepID=A0ABT7L3C2_9BACI|nr:hypothetical protein [Aquibacillus sp. LR5S19]MDL4839869.1 hypothetical protein [Aquibacillus sp. LR5S19]
MVDTYIADKWADDFETEIRPFIKENFEEITDFYVLFINEKIGRELGHAPINPRSYKGSILHLLFLVKGETGTKKYLMSL